MDDGKSACAQSTSMHDLVKLVLLLEIGLVFLSQSGACLVQNDLHISTNNETIALTH